MARVRVKLARILNERIRRSTLEHRILALIKRLQALCVVCEAKASMVVCDGLNDQGTNNQLVWPSRQEVERMMPSFMGVPEQTQNKMVTSEKFLESMLVKEKNKLQMLKEKNDQMEIEEILHKLHISPTANIDIEPMNGKLSKAYFYIDALIKNIEEKENVPQNARDVNVT
ncbi:MADS-box transcription factor PHERES 1-like [Bidens hawaiensis]|uniref:MADS-box transcription factor PHERES 1-like n=1 Tax=Bidens hawaiensis TaxID=980011 RepID=UPI0040496EA7